MLKSTDITEQKNNPIVSVVMSVYNGEKYLQEAIDSIVAQTLKDFEFIIINDGSTDSSKKIIESCKNSQIKLFNQKKHGLVYSLNRGIKLAKGKYIARQDDDDISLPERLEKELTFLQKNLQTVLVGTAFDVVAEDKKLITIEAFPTEDIDLLRLMTIRNPFSHGSIMFRKREFEKAGGYRNTFGPAEDFDLWRRLAQYGQLANLSETLYIWRVNLKGISQTRARTQNKYALRIAEENFDSSNIIKLAPTKVKQRTIFYSESNDKNGSKIAKEYLKSCLSFSNKLLKRGNFMLAVKSYSSYLRGGRQAYQIIFSYYLMILKDKVRRTLASLRAG